MKAIETEVIQDIPNLSTPVSKGERVSLSFGVKGVKKHMYSNYGSMDDAHIIATSDEDIVGSLAMVAFLEHARDIHGHVVTDWGYAMMYWYGLGFIPVFKAVLSVNHIIYNGMMVEKHNSQPAIWRS